MSLITIVGVIGGFVVFLATRRARKAVAEAVSDERTGRIDAREAARIRWEHKHRSFRWSRIVCVFWTLLLVAVLGRAWVSGSWGGMTLYYVVLIGVLLVVSVFVLWRARGELERSR